MSVKKLKVGDLVWAKMKNYPYWPSRIVNPPANLKVPLKKKAQRCVLFFGTNDHGWISEEFIVPHSEDMVLSSSKSNKKISSTLQSAIDEIVELGKNASQGNVSSPTSGESDSDSDEDILAPLSQQIAFNAEKKTGKKKVSENKNDVKTSKISVRKSSTAAAASSEEDEEMVILPKTSQQTANNVETKSISAEKGQKRVKEHLKNKSNKKRKGSTSPPPPKKAEEEDVDDDYDDDEDGTDSDSSSVLLENAPHYEDDPLSPGSNILPAYIERPMSPVFDVGKVSEFLEAKGLTPTDKKIGFLGLGMIGRGLVKNLLHSGHKITIWNRHPEKCDPFISHGAVKGLTPADVVASCDITFCSVSNADAVKSLMFENNGVLKGFEGCIGSNKGYVELTTVDPDISVTISKIIIGFGGRYLEAPIIGSGQHAEEGTVMSIVSGNKDLFDECYSCFSSFTRNVYYLSSTVGNGSKMKIVQSMLSGIMAAGLAEALSLVDRYELSRESFLTALRMGTLNCPFMIEKAYRMCKKDFSTNTALKHQQKDLNLVMKLSNTYHQKTLTAAGANELFKRAKILKYSDHDVSAVFMGTQ